MQSNDTIKKELKELNSILAGIPNTNVYRVPDGYFDVLSHDILLAVRQPAKEAADNSSVPAGYFDGLAGTIMGKIRAGADEGSALLAGLKGINVYRVPPGYFNNLSAEIVNKLPQPAKVVVMEKRSSFFRYAAAAVITGIIGLSVISVFDKKGETGSTRPNPEMAIDIDKGLSTVADQDIVSYLQTSGMDVNAALVASVTDDKNLPEQLDYLTDDKTLDNLLSELNASESTNN
ncbi:MAG: hypothetical protein ABI741_02365 [Ferruginibacter sp.]